MSNQSKFFLVFTLLILGLARTWGLLDEYLLGRFILLSGIGLWAFLFLIREKKDLKVNMLDICLLTYLLVSYLSLIWARLPSAGYLPVQTTLLTYAFYFVFRWHGAKITTPWVFKGLAVLSLVTLLIAFWQIIRLGLNEGLSQDHIYQVSGLSGHKNLLASLIFLLLGLNLLGAIRSTFNKWMIGLMVAQLVVILLLRGRAVYGALFVLGIMVGLYLILTKTVKLKRMLSKMFLLLAAGLLIAVAMFFLLGGTKEDVRNLNPTQYFKSASGIERQFIWYKTRELIKDHWVKGYGAGNWKLVFPSKSIAGGFRLQSQNVTFTRAHNDYLEIWTELGIFGLLAYLGIFILLITGMVYSFKKSSQAFRQQFTLLLGILAGYMIIAFFDFPKERMEHQILLSLLFALIVSLASPFFAHPRFTFDISDKTYTVLRVFLAGLLLLNLVLGYCQIKGEFHTRNALFAQTLGRWTDTEIQYNKAYSSFYQINPAAASVKWGEGLAQYHLGKFDQAEKTLALAYQQTPYHFRTINDYAGCLVQLKKYDEAVQLYLKALFINPKFEEAMFNLAYAYTQLHQFEEAKKWVNKTTGDLQKKINFLNEIKKLETQLNHSED